MYQKAMGVDAIRCAGDQRDEVAAVLYGKAIGLVRQNNLCRDNSIGVILAKNANDEPIPHL